VSFCVVYVFFVGVRERASEGAGGKAHTRTYTRERLHASVQASTYVCVGLNFNPECDVSSFF